METSQTQNICKNCGNSFTGKYCNLCGEKVYGERDRSVMYILEEALHFLTHFEGNFFNTIKTMFRRPGQVSLDYTNGIRKKYYKPVMLFFFLVVIYLVFPGIFPRGLDMQLKYHMGQYPYKGYATRMVEQKMQQKHISYEELAVQYGHRSHGVSKVLLFILLPVSALFLLVLYPGRKRFFDNFMLSTEINAIFLSAFFMILPILLGVLLLIVMLVYEIITGHGVGSDSFLNSELPTVICSTVLFIAFNTVCFRRFYGSSTMVSMLKAILFVALHYILVFYLYKFLLFTTVMWML
jgi:hypothetical protein